MTYGDYVFQNCTALEKVVVEENVTTLTDFMFEGTIALETVALPSTLESIGWGHLKTAKVV